MNYAASTEKVPLSTLVRREPFGTNGVMAEKRGQWKFNVDPQLRSRAEAIFVSQGLNLSGGLERLLLLLVDSPPELHPVILKQANRNAAKVLAEHVLSGWKINQQAQQDELDAAELEATNAIKDKRHRTGSKREQRQER